MGTIITEEELRSGIETSLVSAGWKGQAEVGIDAGARGATVVLQGRLPGTASETRYTIRDAQALKDARRRALEWWRGWQFDDALVSADAFLHGEHGHRASPYMVETALVRLLASRGIGMERFRALMATVSRRADGPARLREETGAVYSSFRPGSIPEAFSDYCWRSNMRALPRGISDAGDIQFRLAGRGGWGLMAYLELAPGVMWMGGSSPAIWLKRHLVPEAVMRNARGRPATDVLGHDALDVPGLKVLSMRHDGKRTVVMLSAVKVDAGAVAADERASLPLAA